MGAVAVLITLIYLALQIQQNRQSVESSAAQAILASISNAIQEGAASPELADLLIRGQNDLEKLSEKERSQFLMWYLSYFRIIEQAYHYYLDGHFKQSIWDGHTRQIQSLVQSHGVQMWWGLRKNVYSSEFQDFIDEIAALDTDVLTSHELSKKFS